MNHEISTVVYKIRTVQDIVQVVNGSWEPKSPSIKKQTVAKIHTVQNHTGSAGFTCFHIISDRLNLDESFFI